MEHWFWTILSAFIVLWYIVVTVIVAIKGGADIKGMFKNWSGNKDAQ